MKRRNFLASIGVLAATAVVTPLALANTATPSNLVPLTRLRNGNEWELEPVRMQDLKPSDEFVMWRCWPIYTVVSPPTCDSQGRWRVETAWKYRKRERLSETCK